jgi:2-dehydro-3-deoxyphosphogalactonate aldolase
MKNALTLEQQSPAIVAILRGIRPEEVVEVGKALIKAGVRIVEVPLNSPEALSSIERLAESIGRSALVGAGTVLTPGAVEDAAASGAKFVVSPNCVPAVISRTLELDLEPMPGVLSPTEAIAAVAAGARHLKLFPAASIGHGHIKALLDVLPGDCRLWAVGGITAGNALQWAERGAFGVGVGSSLYRPGASAGDIRQQAGELVDAWLQNRP